MLPKKRRIDKKTFPKTSKGRAFFGQKEFTVRATEAEKKDLPSLFSVVVSKKVSAQAVERNKTRRRFYSAIQEVLKGKESKGYYYIFFVNKEIKEKNFKDLVEVLKKTIK